MTVVIVISVILLACLFLWILGINLFRLIFDLVCLIFEFLFSIIGGGSGSSGDGFGGGDSGGGGASSDW
jgi:hypothetical protein